MESGRAFTSGGQCQCALSGSGAAFRGRNFDQGVTLLVLGSGRPSRAPVDWREVVTATLRIAPSSARRAPLLVVGWVRRVPEKQTTKQLLSVGLRSVRSASMEPTLRIKG